MGATAVVGGAVLGGMIQGNAAQNAASTEASAANNAAQMQWNEFQQEQNNLKPYQQAGEGALTQLQQQLPDLTRQFTMADFQNNPGYQFQLQQGQQAVQNSAAARGLLNSSAAMKNMDAYTQGMANTDYQQALQNFTGNQQQRYNMLAGIASAGQGAVNSVNQAGQNAANQAGQNMMGAANAQAAGQVGMANAVTGAMGTGMNTWMQQQYLNKLNPQAPMPGYMADAGQYQNAILGQSPPFANGNITGGDNINLDYMTA